MTKSINLMYELEGQVYSNIKQFSHFITRVLA